MRSEPQITGYHVTCGFWVGVAGFEPEASSSRSQVAVWTVSGASCPAWERSSVGVRRRPRLAVAIVTHLVTRSLGESAAALLVRRDDQADDHDDRGGRKYQDHREDVLEDPVLACYPLPVLQRHPGPGRMIAGGRIVQVESPAAPAPAVRWLSLSRAANPDHHASAALPPLCGQCSAVQDARKGPRRRALVELSGRT